MPIGRSFAKYVCTTAVCSAGGGMMMGGIDLKFGTDKKKAIMQYILEKVAVSTKGVSDCVAKAFDISTTTVHGYLNELIEQGIIEKKGRGYYQLISRSFSYELKRSQGDLETDTHAFDVCLREHIEDLPENVREIWEYAFTEMVNNVMDHSGAENMHISVIQNYLSTYVMIMDDGIGIFEKIKEHFSLPGLDEAICELFKGKLTTDEINHSGEGIFFTSKMMDTFFIFSQKKIFTTSKYNNENIFDMDDVLSGTCVLMSLSNFSHKSVRDVFNLYADVDGGFTKTRVPLKNIFDVSPVSRSQAKRVCNRLDKFQEVILDFDGIKWMGQGFAHQLFVVYGKAHSDVKLVPINMNEDVTNMYNHVIKTAGA